MAQIYDIFKRKRYKIKLDDIKIKITYNLEKIKTNRSRFFTNDAKKIISDFKREYPEHYAKQN